MYDYGIRNLTTDPSTMSEELVKFDGRTRGDIYDGGDDLFRYRRLQLSDNYGSVMLLGFRRHSDIKGLISTHNTRDPPSPPINI
jgi:hypothetical protein